MSAGIIGRELLGGNEEPTLTRIVAMAMLERPKTDDVVEQDARLEQKQLFVYFQESSDHSLCQQHIHPGYTESATGAVGTSEDLISLLVPYLSAKDLAIARRISSILKSEVERQQRSLTLPVTFGNT